MNQNTEEIESALHKAQQFMLKIFPNNPEELAKLLMESFARGYDEAKPKWRSVKDDPPPLHRPVLVRRRNGDRLVAWHDREGNWRVLHGERIESPDEWMEIPE